jgi:hypothetical protein
MPSQAMKTVNRSLPVSTGKIPKTGFIGDSAIEAVKPIPYRTRIPCRLSAGYSMAVKSGFDP